MIAPTLTTERIILEPLSMAHWEEYATMWADPRTTEFIGGKPRERNESWIKFCAGIGLWNLLGYGYWAFVNRESDVLLGVGGLSQWERGLSELNGFPETGWGFAPDAWGKGYATEAMRAALDWADTALEIRETRCIIDPENQSSQRVAAKLGYSKIGHNADAIGPVDIYVRKVRG